ncbi:MFS transporter [Microbacterium mangrovi]|uniref:MFS transporter n=1 Tax=Microbacterium mangrovi TaxID=1348253 RepID=UPI0006910C44|nr:MFS transporter [Microbacterium mangrovi]
MTASDLPEIPDQTSAASRHLLPLSLTALTFVVVFGAAELRAPILSVAPLAHLIESELGIGAATVGLLTSIPVLCFALCSPLAIWVIRRGGADFAFTIAMTGIVVGTILRSLGGLPMLLVGTAVIGAFVTIGNIVIPTLIGREYRGRRAHTMTGVFTSSMTLGTFAVTIGTAPAAAAIGWQAALAMWLVFGAAALAVWLPLRGLRDAVTPRGTARAVTGDDHVPMVRRRTTWLLAAAFAGQSFSFYAATAWLPSIVGDLGYSDSVAGVIAAIFQIFGVIGSLLTPLVVSRASARVVLVVAGLFWLTVPLGFLLLPHGWVVWCVLGGLAQGAGITIIFVLMNGFGGTEHVLAERSGIVQGAGYAVAATGPLLLGALHQVSGAWALPELVLLVTVLMFAIAGLVSARLLKRGVEVETG